MKLLVPCNSPIKVKIKVISLVLQERGELERGGLGSEGLGGRGGIRDRVRLWMERKLGRGGTVRCRGKLKCVVFKHLHIVHDRR